MIRSRGFVLALEALFMLLAVTGTAHAYQVTGDVVAGWGTTGGSLWFDILKETAISSDGGFDGSYERGVLARPASSKDLPNPLNTTNHNWIETDYVLISGRDGQRALYAVGELDPRFGNVAVTLTCAKAGRCESAGGGRRVRDVSTIEVVRAATNIKNVPNTAHPYAPWLVVSGAGIVPKTFSLSDLKASTLEQVKFDDSASSSNTKGIWTGPTLRSVLKAAGVDKGDTESQDSYLVVQAADGYATVLSMVEAVHQTGPQFALLGIGDSLANTLNNGTCTDAESANTKCKDGGAVRLVLPGNLAAGRWPSNVVHIVVYRLEKANNRRR